MLSARKFAAIILFAAAITSRGENVDVPNYSFEQPPVPPDVPAYPVHVAWQQTPKRADYVDNPPFTWNVLTGVFANTAAGSADHIDNMDGSQAAYLFSERENGIFQILTNKYATGFSYTLTVGLLGSPNIPPTTGTTLALTLYYTNSNSEIVPLATTTVTYDTTTFPAGTHFRDFTVRVPPFQNSSPANNQNIGILIKSTTTDDKAGGVWDIDNVRLAAVREVVMVPNFSFENPPVPTGAPAYPVINNWQKFPQPSYWDEATMGPWDNLAGVFPNPAPTDAGYIDNIERAQAAYIFATPGNGIFQDLSTKYELDATYILTVGVIGSTSIPPTNNTPLTIALYYRDDQSNMVTIATKTIAFNSQNFPNATHMIDLSATSSGVNSAAPWLGKNIGISIASAAGFDSAGGVWDVDNVRLTVGHGVKLRFATVGTHLRISFDSEAATPYQVWTAFDVSDQFVVLTPDPITGNGSELSLDLPIAGAQGFFEIRALAP